MIKLIKSLMGKDEEEIKKGSCCGPKAKAADEKHGCSCSGSKKETKPSCCSKTND